MSDDRLERLNKRMQEAQVRATEAALDLFGTFDFPGVPQDIYGDVDGLQPVPPGGIPPYYRNNQGRGEVLPVYTSWLQLKYIRDRSRRLCRENEFAICAINNRKNYVVGDGFTYRATGPDDNLNTPAQQVIDLWSAGIELAEYELDAMERLDMDGEFFLRFFYRDTGLLELRFIEPEHIKDVLGDPYSPAESFGIVTDIDDVENVIGYQVIEQPWNNDMPTFVPADEIMHVTLNVPRNAKRGLPTLYPVQANLKRANDLLSSMAAMAKTRAKIALIRKMLNATGSAAANMANSLSVGTVTDPKTNQIVSMEQIKPGTILTSTGNIEYEMPGANVDAAGFVEVLQAELRGIAARLNMPEWMLTANNDATNYNQAFVSESHAVKEFRRLQRMMCRRFGESRHAQKKSVVWRQLEYAVQLGLLDPATLTRVKIQCEGPSLIAREKGEEAETNQIYLEMGIKSRSTIAQELGLDYGQEKLNKEKEDTARVKKASAAAPAAVRQQESEQPNLDDYVSNRFAAKGYPSRENGDSDNVHDETGFILRNGRPVQMGPPGQRLHQHFEASPSHEEMQRWGYPASVINSPSGQFAGLTETMRRNGMVRFSSGKQFGATAVESTGPLSHQQKQAVHNYALRYKPSEFMFTRVIPKDDGDFDYKHTFVKPGDLEDHLFGVHESVKVTEKTDATGHAHNSNGGFVQPEFDPAGAPFLPDPLGKAAEFTQRSNALNQDYILAAQQHAANLQKLQEAAYTPADGKPVDPKLLDQLNQDVQKSMQDVRKKYEAAQNAQKQAAQVQPGPMKLTESDLDRMLTSGPFSILSAWKNGKNPTHDKVSEEEFAERHKQLGEDLLKGGYKYTEMKGKYGGLEEPSYLVQAADEHRHIIRSLAYKNGQESVIHSHKGQNELAYVTGPASGQAHRGTRFQYLPDADDNYSEYNTADGKKVRFALNLDFNDLHEAQEQALPQSSYTGFTPEDLRTMQHNYLPPKDRVEDTHNPADVVKYFHDLSGTLKSRTGSTLQDILTNNKHPLHSSVGESVVNAIHGGPFTGSDVGGWDSRKTNRKGVVIGHDNKMTAAGAIANRKVRLAEGEIYTLRNKAARTQAFPILTGFNPGTGMDYSMIVAHKGSNNFPTRDTPDLRAKVGKGDAAVLFKGQLNDLLTDPKAVANAQNEWKKLAHSVKPDHLLALERGTLQDQADKHISQVVKLAKRGDTTALKYLADRGLSVI